MPLMQIRFFHKVASMPAPATDAEKLIRGVLDAEQPYFRLIFTLLLFSWIQQTYEITKYSIFCVFAVSCTANLS